MSSGQVRFEQAVYGSFPFWHRGYAVLARSAGCRASWLEALQRAGQRFGERPTGVIEAASLFALPLRRGPWMIIGAFPLGCDDQGRPGALAFHGLFVSRWTYWRAGLNPFVFAPALRDAWSEADQDVTLPSGTLSLPGRRAVPAPVEGTDPRVQAIVAALSQRHRVVVPSAEPIEDLARDVWSTLPCWVRRRASVATWAFRNDNRFDLVALPRTAGNVDDPAEIVLTAASDDSRGDEAQEGERSGIPAKPPREQRWGCLVPMVGLIVLSAGFAWWRFPRPEPVEAIANPARPEARASRAERRATRADSPPMKGKEPILGAEGRRRLNEAIADLLERFDPTGSEASISGAIVDRSRPAIEDAQLVPSLIRLAGRLRYRGGTLSDEDLDRLRVSAEGSAHGAGNDAALALKWHALVGRYRDDRPLPDDFSQGGFAWQLATLAWSYHLEDDPAVRQALSHGALEESVHALVDALTVDVPLPATSLSDRYPPLADYRRFLAGRPRR